MDHIAGYMYIWCPGYIVKISTIESITNILGIRAYKISVT